MCLVTYINAEKEWYALRSERECLVGALTLLCLNNVLVEYEVDKAITEGGFDGLFDLLNKKYKEIKPSGDVENT